jgi:hypothetical protein
MSGRGFRRWSSQTRVHTPVRHLFSNSTESDIEARSIPVNLRLSPSWETRMNSKNRSRMGFAYRPFPVWRFESYHGLCIRYSLPGQSSRFTLLHSPDATGARLRQVSAFECCRVMAATIPARGDIVASNVFADCFPLEIVEFEENTW